MNKNNKKIILIVFISLSLFGLFVYFLQTIKNLPPPSLPQISVEKKGGGLVILKINDSIYENEIVAETNIYDFMDKLRSEGKINFTEKNYTGIGKFITSINGISGDGNKNWIYYVNGIEAQVGVSNYKIKSGDIVSWKYEKNY